MTKDQLLEFLAECEARGDNERAHSAADYALLDYINDPEIKAAWERGADHWWWA